MNSNLFKRIISSIILLIISTYVIIKGSFLFNIFLLILLLISLIEWHKMSYKNFYYLPGIILLIISFISVYKVRNDHNDNNLFNFLFIFIICIMTDIGGYIFGKIFKGPKLTRISPNKTYSGVLGGFFLAIIGSVFFFSFTNDFFVKPNLSSNYLFFFIIVISITSQIGDLIFSLFKRLSNLKDTGKIIPGHGGLLDRIDGMIFAYPISYLLTFNL